MRSIATILVSTMLLSACATGRNYSTRAELLSDPGSQVEITSAMPVAQAFALLRDLTFACFEFAHIRVYSESPGPDGKGGSVTISTAQRILDAKVVTTTLLAPSDTGGTVATIYSAGDKPPAAVLSRYPRWLGGGSKACNE
jgi:hypothetical protein